MWVSGRSLGGDIGPSQICPLFNQSRRLKSVIAEPNSLWRQKPIKISPLPPYLSIFRIFRFVYYPTTLNPMLEDGVSVGSPLKRSKILQRCMPSITMLQLTSRWEPATWRRLDGLALTGLWDCACVRERVGVGVWFEEAVVQVKTRCIKFAKESIQFFADQCTGVRNVKLHNVGSTEARCTFHSEGM